MWERTLTICSAGKSFECTGWKIGWVHGHEDLCRTIQTAHQWIPFCVASPLQFAVGEAIAEAERIGWFPELRKS
eukprot:UN02358